MDLDGKIVGIATPRRNRKRDERPDLPEEAVPLCKTVKITISLPRAYRERLYGVADGEVFSVLDR